MSFDKHYARRKDWRKPYYRRGKNDPTCRPNGSCPYCRRERMFGIRKRMMIANETLKSFEG